MLHSTNSEAIGARSSIDLKSFLIVYRLTNTEMKYYWQMGLKYIVLPNHDNNLMVASLSQILCLIEMANSFWIPALV